MGYISYLSPMFFNLVMIFISLRIRRVICRFYKNQEISSDMRVQPLLHELIFLFNCLVQSGWKSVNVVQNERSGTAGV